MDKGAAAGLAFLVMLATLVLGAFYGCGSTARGSGNFYATEIPGPGGVRCFVITDGMNTVGGNCK